jgi:hypothetical protein
MSVKAAGRFLRCPVHHGIDTPGCDALAIALQLTLHERAPRTCKQQQARQKLREHLLRHCPAFALPSAAFSDGNRKMESESAHNVGDSPFSCVRSFEGEERAKP